MSEEIINRMSVLSSCATLPLPQYFAKELTDWNIKPRDLPRNVLFGTTYSVSHSGYLIIGVTYWDWKDFWFNEDLFLLPCPACEPQKIKPSEVDKLLPEYKKYHYGEKYYLV